MTEGKEKGRALANTSYEPPPGPVVPVAVPSDEPDPYLGQTLRGLYRLDQRIGVGGMGSVYAATHVHLGKRFAVKLLSPSISQNRDSVERLRQEAVLASSIDHDNIVDMVSLDTTESGVVFIVMELLQGQSMASLVAGGAVEAERAVRLVLPVCSALQAAHERGIVHRDLKPENVFLASRNGQEIPKVLDFGISKMKEKEAEQVRLTHTGQLVGTPLYMSPEQAKGETEVDSRADIYSLGVILYELVTGMPPFTGGNYFQLLWKHGNELPVPPRQRAPERNIPPAVDAVIMKALAKKPEERFTSMNEFAAELTRCLSEPGAVVATMRESRIRSNVLYLGVAVVSIVVAAAIVLAMSPKAPPPVRPHMSKAPAAHPAPPVPQPSAPELIEVSITSTPPGATVALDGVVLPEVTPTVARVPVPAKDTHVRLSLTGYGDRELSVNFRTQRMIQETLVATPRKGRPAAGPTPKIKTNY